ncbi:phage/plasmid primase, P4 family [Lysinibacillus sp. fls2-241-R2A-57]|uniref:DNA primase family protein n=1 Tax=Lysinibacillus sp. fls2-241-R2A-57 TaxID=3040292 RepID=UPI002553268B|nr:phage/plasmid primase, P4 family [Lysinibacillus sp. fls2-241-R2A-57]
MKENYYSKINDLSFFQESLNLYNSESIEDANEAFITPTNAIDIQFNNNFDDDFVDISLQEIYSKESKNNNSSSKKTKKQKESLSNDELAKILIQSNQLIVLENVLHYWSEEEKRFIPLLGEAADRFIRQRIPNQYKKKINQYSIKEIIQWLKSKKELKKEKTLSQQNNLVPFKNGVFDVNTYELYPHDSRYFFVNLINAAYPDENSYISGNHFEQFIYDITGGNQELYDRLQELFGFVLSEIRDVKYIPFLVGAKDTGKSIVLKLLEYLVGEDSFTNLNFDQLNRPEYLAELFGKKLNTCGELSEFKLNRLDNFKKLSGGDFVTARPIYERPIKFINTAALIFAGNHLPIINGIDKGNAFSGRLVIFPFNNPIPKENQDINLFGKLTNETSYIAAWAMEGLSRWINNNYQFTTCETIINLSNRYAEQSNSIENFIKKCCKFDTSLKIFKYEIEDAYQNYCNENGLATESSKLLQDHLKLNTRLTHCRFRKDGINKFGYIGLGIID